MLNRSFIQSTTNSVIIIFFRAILLHMKIRKEKSIKKTPKNDMSVLNKSFEWVGHFFLAKFFWNQDGSQKLSAIHIYLKVFKYVLGIGYFRRYYWSLAEEKKGFFMFKAKLVAEHVGSMSTQPTPAAHNGLK